MSTTDELETMDFYMSIDPDKINAREKSELIDAFFGEKHGELGPKNEEEKQEVKKKVKEIRDESDGNPNVPISGPYTFEHDPPFVFQRRVGYFNPNMTGIIPIHEMRGLILCSHDEWPTLKSKIEQDFVAAFGEDENVLAALTIEVQ